MKCLVCGRQLLHCAVPEVPIGPKCAKRRGLMPAPTRRQAVRLFSNTTRTPPDPAQVDWVNLINAGGFAGESHA